MDNDLRLMAVLAHPDDESLGLGSTLARYSAEGIKTHLVTATRGERGWTGEEQDFPGLAELGRIREAELRAAAKVLGLQQPAFLDYMDGDLDQADPGEAMAKIASAFRTVRPQVVITFDPAGAYGHPDHIAISQFTTGASVLAADPEFNDPGGLPPYRISKLYYMAIDQSLATIYASVFGDIRMNIDGTERSMVPWEDWAYTTVIDGSDYWRTALEAVNCHQSQVGIYGDLNKLPLEKSLALWGKKTYYRALSLVNGGRQIETDLFEGLR